MPVLTGLHATPPAARWSEKRAAMPMEFLHGRPLSPEDLEMIRRQVEEFEVIGVADREATRSDVDTRPAGRATMPQGMAHNRRDGGNFYCDRRRHRSG
jgi:hypothetical protein